MTTSPRYPDLMSGRSKILIIASSLICVLLGLIGRNFVRARSATANNTLIDDLRMTENSLTGGINYTPAQAAEIRREHKQTRDQDGQVDSYIDSVYRGKERILLTDIRLKKNKYRIRMIRAYFANGKDVVDEIDYEDGTQVIRLYKDDSLSEMFRRQVDGTVEPVSSEELAVLKARQHEMMEASKK
ncbi:MAG: hypothetical protein QOJ40_1138 [Verrucomicrobiota bacterium]